MECKKYTDFAVEQLQNLTAVPSPSGFTKMAAAYLMKTFADLGYEPVTTNKGSITVNLGGTGDGLVLAAHVDTLGAMVRSVKDNGRLRLTRIGGFNWNTADGENCTIFTRDGRSYTGVLLNTKPSVHVFPADIKYEEANMELLLNENVSTKEETLALGIKAGDFVAADPRTQVTPSGFINSRFLDDKASAAVLIALAKYLKENKIVLKYSVSLLFTVYEEVGHGGASGLPEGVSEMISVDMGCVGDDLSCTEKQVSICAKDSGGPYNYDVTTALIAVAESLKLDYVVDVYPSYSSDVDVSLKAGYEIKHGLIGPGVYASHNYERTHWAGLDNTLKLLIGYIG